VTSPDSLTKAPDVEAASNEYAERFSGAVGEWFLSVQEAATLQMLAPYPEAGVLDVGGGHGQTAVPLIENGYDLTILGSSEACKTQVRNLVEDGKCRFDVGDVIELPYPDDCFDVVISYRMVPHIREWERFLAELSRVSRKAVVIDYPDTRSFNYFKKYFFYLKKSIEEGTRRYKCFKMSTLLSRLEELGMSYSDHYRQFFWPMFLHRGMGSVRLSMPAEKACREIGLTSLWGAPVILKVVHSEPEGR
jgi:ubiquinone/menaquinone biosynthesis C-methylase UbiE